MDSAPLKKDDPCYGKVEGDSLHETHVAMTYRKRMNASHRSREWKCRKEVS